MVAALSNFVCERHMIDCIVSIIDCVARQFTVYLQDQLEHSYCRLSVSFNYAVWSQLISAVQSGEIVIQNVPWRASLPADGGHWSSSDAYVHTGLWTDGSGTHQGNSKCAL